MEISVFVFLMFISFMTHSCKEEKEFSLPYEKYVLENGLEVVNKEGVPEK